MFECSRLGQLSRRKEELVEEGARLRDALAAEAESLERVLGWADVARGAMHWVSSQRGWVATGLGVLTAWGMRSGGGTGSWLSRVVGWVQTGVRAAAMVRSLWGAWRGPRTA
jgi:hypothetical protein